MRACDYAIRIGRYFDRDPADTSCRTFEEWQPRLVFTPADKVVFFVAFALSAQRSCVLQLSSSACFSGR